MRIDSYRIIIWDIHHIEPLIKMGITHFIIMHPSFSVGYPSKTPFQEEALITLKHRHPDLSLALLADRLFHQEHLDDLDHYLSQSTCFDCLHIQDLGALALIHETYPSIKICWVDSFMSMNQISLQTLSNFGIDSCLISHQLPLSAIQIPKDIQPLILIQGPLCIQYAKRRYFSEAGRDMDSHYHAQGDDTEVPGRPFRFVQSKAGTAMYAHFDRSLLHVLDKIPQLFSWLIDARFYTLDQITTIIETYQNPKASQTKLDEHLGIPQRPGFFLANKTNRDWRNHKMALKASSEIIGEVISTADDSWMIIESLQPIDPKTSLLFISPIQKEQKSCLNEIYSPDGKPLKKGHPYKLIKIKKIKYITEKSLVLKD